MSVKERIQEYIDSKGISVYKLETSVGLSKGYWSKTKSISADVAMKISRIYTDISPEWLLTGEGNMLKEESPKEAPERNETRPRIPYTATAGTLTNSMAGIRSEECEQIPRIIAFPDYDFTIQIKGNSMEPKYEGGDEVACKRVDNTSFIQWGKVHVLDTSQGIVIKRVYDDGERIRCVSYNPEYPDFSIDKKEIYSMSLVVGLLRM